MTRWGKKKAKPNAIEREEKKKEKESVSIRLEHRREGKGNSRRVYSLKEKRRKKLKTWMKSCQNSSRGREKKEFSTWLQKRREWEATQKTLKGKKPKL